MRGSETMAEVAVPFNIKKRARRLDLTQVQLCHLLNNNGFPELSPTVLQKYLGGYITSERRDAVLSKADEILTKLENEERDE